MDKRVYEFDEVDVHSESPKAYHCDIAGLMFWVPKSQIKKFEIDEGLLVTTAWWADISGAAQAYELHLAAEERARQERARQHAQEQANARAQAPPVYLFHAQTIYRKLALKYHPDKNPDSAEIMRDLNELWQAVKEDLDKR